MFRGSKSFFAPIGAFVAPKAPIVGLDLSSESITGGIGHPTIPVTNIENINPYVERILLITCDFSSLNIIQFTLIIIVYAIF